MNKRLLSLLVTVLIFQCITVFSQPLYPGGAFDRREIYTNVCVGVSQGKTSIFKDGLPARYSSDQSLERRGPYRL
jgi:hypothetical protein